MTIFGRIGESAGKKFPTATTHEFSICSFRQEIYRFRASPKMDIVLPFWTSLSKMGQPCQALTSVSAHLVGQLHREACFGREMKRQNINTSLPATAVCAPASSWRRVINYTTRF